MVEMISHTDILTFAGVEKHCLCLSLQNGLLHSVMVVIGDDVIHIDANVFGLNKRKAVGIIRLGLWLGFKIMATKSWGTQRGQEVL
jgi:hypothetical protein